jgi:hypothetical protein
MSITSTAEVLTDRSERFAKQLVTHLGRKIEWVTEDGVSTASFGTASASVAPTDGVLVLTASGTSLEEVAQIEDALARHLHKFAFRHPVEISWNRKTIETVL